MKACSACKNILPEEQFFKDRQKRDGLTCRCKSCVKEHRDKEYRRKYDKKYRLEHLEYRKMLVANANNKNREKYKEKRREYLKTDAGIQMYKRQTQKRYALKKKAFREDVDMSELFSESGGKCFYCEKELTIKTMTIDHYIPLSKGGLHEKANLRVSCLRCNLSKGAKLPTEWRR